MSLPEKRANIFFHTNLHLNRNYWNMHHKKHKPSIIAELLIAYSKSFVNPTWYIHSTSLTGKLFHLNFYCHWFNKRQKIFYSHFIFGSRCSRRYLLIFYSARSFRYGYELQMPNFSIFAWCIAVVLRSPPDDEVYNKWRQSTRAEVCGF